MKKVLLIIGIPALLIGGVYIAFSKRKGGIAQPIDQTVDVLTGVGAIETKKEVADPQLAVIRAKAIFQKLEAESADLSSGPCIAEDLMSDWVADVAHNPRMPLDDLPQNQCQAYREGRAHHFVELDPNGAVLSVH